MVDPGTGLAVLGSAPVVMKILGPTADYVGDGLQHWTERRIENVQRVFRKAEHKLGEEGLNRSGAVPPRVLKEILSEGSFCDDELGAEYLGGVLASSKSGVPRDDRGAALASLVGRLSTYQLRGHYLMYATARRWLTEADSSGAKINLGLPQDQKKFGRFFVPFQDWSQAMDFSAEEENDPGILVHIVTGLMREGLLGAYATGPAGRLSKAVPDTEFPEEGGIIFEVSLLGIELFVMAHGYRGAKAPKTVIKTAVLDFEIEESIELGSDSQWLRSAADNVPLPESAVGDQPDG